MSTAPMPNEIEMEGRVPIFQAPEFEGSPAVVPVHPMQQVSVHPNHQASIYGMQQVPVNQIQNPIPIQPAAFPRVQFKTRWMYGYFAIAAGLYHVIWTILWGLILGLPNHLYWTLAFLVLGFIPSLMTVILIIMDSTVLCCGSRTDAYRLKIRRYIVAIPLGIAALLRILLYIIIFGQWANFLNDYESKNFIDDVFWIIMVFGAFDAGPMILLAVDWWYYYSEPSRNGIFGNKTNPMRCVVGQSTLLFVASWSFVALVNEYAPVHEVAEFMWPWLVHGVISAAALIFCAISQCSGNVTANKLSNKVYQYASRLLAVLMGTAVIPVVIFISQLKGGFGSWLYLYYYTALWLPAVVAMASFKAQEHCNAVTYQ